MPLSSAATVTSANQSFEYATSNIPAFLSKLWTLVEDRKYDELIAWDQSGFSFHVFDQTRFAREILPRFFKHNNMASFIRQLNMYGFRKVNSIDHGGLKSEKEDMEFHHPYFIKGKEQFLEFIKRKVPDMKAMQQQQQQQGGQQQQQQVNNSQINNNIGDSSSNSVDSLQMVKVEELNRVLDEVNTMKSKQKVVDDSLFAVKKENEALWKEIASLRQKHHHQQQIVNKLIHFLVHLVNPTSLSGMKRIRPLMIDGYGSNNSAVIYSVLQQLDNFAVGVDDDDQDEDEALDSELIGDLESGGISGGNNGSGNNSTAHRNRHIVELNEDDEEEESYNHGRSGGGGGISGVPTSILHRAQQVNSSPSRHHRVAGTGNTGGSNSISTILNDTNTLNRIAKRINNNAALLLASDDGGEIETINTARKNNNINNNAVFKHHQLLEESSAVEPLNKKPRTDDTLVAQNVSSSSFYGSHSNPVRVVEVYNKPSYLNIHQGLDQGGQLSTELNTPQDFLDASMFLNTPDQSQLRLPVVSSQQQQQSPNGNIIVNNDLSQQQQAGLDNKPIITLPESPNEMINNRPDNNNNQMNDHIESLQLDLNSIKDFLSTNSFHPIDQYAINNIFSPLVLDQIENEASVNSSNEPTTFYIGDKNDSVVEAYSASDSLNQDHQHQKLLTTNNGKIIGNELAHYDPTAFNAAEFITNSQSSAKATSSQSASQQQQHQIQQSQSSQEFISSSNPMLLTDELNMSTPPVSFADGLQHPARGNLNQDHDDEDAILSTPLL